MGAPFIHPWFSFHLNLLNPTSTNKGDMAACSRWSETKSWRTRSEHLPHLGGNIVQGYHQLKQKDRLGLSEHLPHTGGIIIQGSNPSIHSKPSACPSIKSACRSALKILMLMGIGVSIYSKSSADHCERIIGGPRDLHMHSNKSSWEGEANRNKTNLNQTIIQTKPDEKTDLLSIKYSMCQFSRFLLLEALHRVLKDNGM